MINVIEELKKSNRKIYIHTTGGGSLAISWLLQTGGASNVFVGGSIPYAQTELQSLIGKFGQACSVEVAKKLAKDALKRSNDIGIGCTCSLAKNGEERADRQHHSYICVNSEQYSTNVTCKEKYDGLRRDQEEKVAAHILFLVYKTIFGVDSSDLQTYKIGPTVWVEHEFYKEIE